MSAVTSPAVEIDARTDERATVAARLARGEVVLLRGIDAIATFREGFVEAVGAGTAGGRAEMDGFLGSARIPSLATLSAVARTIRQVRARRYLSQCLAPFVAQLGFQGPVRLDGGIPRCVVPPTTIAEAKASPLFAPEDFERVRADGETEAFMPRPANVHRDYNRQHFLLQCNLWFPLHDAAEDEVLRIYPHLYRETIGDMDATPENFSRLGAPLRYRLNFGDAILFHGEHLHTSPPIRAEFRRRFSYDFRIASFCGDDTRHYREFFLDLRNFDLAERHKLPLERSSESSPLSTLLAVEQGDVRDEAGFTQALEVFERFPFAEDRYMIVAERAAPVAPLVAVQACQKIVDHSPHWFWNFMAAAMLLRLRQPAVRALEKARSLAADVGELPDFMPMRYPQGPTQPLPQAAVAACERLLSSLRVAAPSA